MTHKVHPKVYRIRKIGDWNSRGFYNRNFSWQLEEDFRIREFLKKRLGRMAVEKIEIERSPGRMNIIISTARPGLIIGRGGEGVEMLKKLIEAKVLQKPLVSEILARSQTRPQRAEKKKKAKNPAAFQKNLLSDNQEKSREKKEVRIEIREIKNQWTSASLIAQWAAQQLEKRLPHRRVIKQAIGKIMANKEIKGVKIEISGRLGGNEIARREWLKEGRLPLQTIRADIDYAKAEAFCVWGVIGVKVWLYKGEKFE